MEWLYYLLEANLYLLLFYGFYRLVLAKTTFYSSNRYYLIAAILFSFLIPVVQISFLRPTIINGDDFINANIERLSSTTRVEFIIKALYFVICSFFILKLTLSLSKIAALWKNGTKHKSVSYTIVELNEKPSAFSFFNLLFIHPSLINNETIIRHEMVHIKEKHSLDLLLLELVNVISWFNPINYFIKKDLMLLHEFIADQATTNEQHNKHQYAIFLIESSLYNFSIPFTNQFFNQQILKQRINMLNKEKTAKWVRLNFVLAIPLLVGMLCVSTLAFSKDYGYFDILSKGKALQDTTKKMRKPLQPPPPPKQDRAPLPPPPPKQTRKPLAPPPPPKQEQAKFPPPIIKSEQKNKKRPPAVVSPRPKKDVVKFPPPIIKSDKKAESATKQKIEEQARINKDVVRKKIDEQASIKKNQRIVIDNQKKEIEAKVKEEIRVAKEKREKEKLEKIG